MKNHTYSVTISYDGNEITFAQGLENDVQAVQLAIALHQSSNVPHCIMVYNELNDTIVYFSTEDNA